MEFHLPILFFIFSILSLRGYADQTFSPAVYWKKVLPNTSMPKAITDSFYSEWSDNKGTSVSVGEGGVGVHTSKPYGGGTHVSVGKGGVGVQTGKPYGGGGTHVSVGKGGVGVQTGKPYGHGGGTHVSVGKGGVGVQTGKPYGGGGTHVSVGKGGVGVQTGKPYGGGGTHVSVGKGGVGVQTGKPYGHGGGTHVSVGKGGVGVQTGKHYGHGGGTQVGVGHGGVTVHTGPKHKPVYVGVGHSSSNPFIYNYAATETQLRDDPNVALFFLQEDLKPGTKKTLHFPRTTGGAAFLPRHVAASIPFSTAEFPAILRRFSVAPGSEEAAVMKQTIKECEQNDVVGEEKYCPTSLESMVDFAVSKLGGKDSVTAVSTDAESDDGKKKEFTVKSVKEVSSGELVACHKGKYPYAVFYCHKTKSTSAYTVELVADGKAVEAVAVCHKDTSAWNPKHLAFQVLKVKPGSVPVCHFLPEDHVVWARN